MGKSAITKGRDADRPRVEEPGQAPPPGKQVPGAAEWASLYFSVRMPSASVAPGAGPVALPAWTASSIRLPVSASTLFQ